MEKDRFARFTLLTALFVTGLIAAGVGTVLGLGEAFQGEKGVIKATTSDGKVIITQRSGDKLTKIGEIQTEVFSKNKNKAEEVIRVALGDERIKKLVGENYHHVEVCPKIGFETKLVHGKPAVVVTTRGELYDVTIKTTWVERGEAWMRTVEATVDLETGRVSGIEVEEHPKPLPNEQKSVAIPEVEKEMEKIGLVKAEQERIVREAVGIVGDSGVIPYKCPLRVLTSSFVFGGSGDVEEVWLQVDCGGKKYSVVVDWRRKEVVSVEELGDREAIGVCYRDGEAVDCDKLGLRGPHAPSKK